MLAMDATRSLGELSTLYLLRCEVEGKSAQTVRAYRETLGRFRRVVSVDDAAAVTPADAHASSRLWGRAMLALADEACNGHRVLPPSRQTAYTHPAPRCPTPNQAMSDADARTKATGVRVDDLRVA